MVFLLVRFPVLFFFIHRETIMPKKTNEQIEQSLLCCVCHNIVLRRGCCCGEARSSHVKTDRFPQINIHTQNNSMLRTIDMKCGHAV